jgi:acyl carrier protein
MDSTLIPQVVRRFIVENYPMASDFRFEDSDSFLARGIIDSTGILELIAFLQDTYGIVIDDEELVPENLDSINAVSRYVHRKLNGATGETNA